MKVKYKSWYYRTGYDCYHQDNNRKSIGFAAPTYQLEKTTTTTVTVLLNNRSLLLLTYFYLSFRRRRNCVMVGSTMMISKHILRQQTTTTNIIIIITQRLVVRAPYRLANLLPIRGNVQGVATDHWSTHCDVTRFNFIYIKEQFPSMGKMEPAVLCSCTFPNNVYCYHLSA